MDYTKTMLLRPDMPFRQTPLHRCHVGKSQSRDQRSRTQRGHWPRLYDRSAFDTELAGMIVSALPAMEMVRFVNSGTEATMSAIRLARAYTARDLIVKCIGCYHGHVDSLLVQAGSGALTLGTPSSPGVPETTTRSTVSVAYNDLDAAKKV